MNIPETIPDQQKILLEKLYNQYAKSLAGYGMRVYKMEEDIAWELAYKTIFRLSEKINQYTFENEKKQNGFVFKTYINYLRNYLRDNKYKPGELSLEENQHELAEDEKKENDSPQMKILNEELEKMEDWERMLLLLRSQEMSYSEIRKYIDKPESQLKVYYQRLKQRLTQRINERLSEK